MRLRRGAYLTAIMTSAPELTTLEGPFPIAALLTAEIPRKRSFQGLPPPPSLFVCHVVQEEETRRTQNIQLLLGLQDQRAGGKHARQVLELEGQRDDEALRDALVLRVDALDGRLGRRLGARGQVYLGAGFGQQGDGRYPYPAAGVGVSGDQLVLFPACAKLREREQQQAV